MLIDFKHTSQNSQNQIEYYNVRGQVVKTYQLSQLELWVIEQDLLNTGEIEEIAECDNPFSKHYKLMDHPIYDDLDNYIENNWDKVTEDFYNAMNPTEYQANNKPQQTKEAV